jgi:hypothetical protein
LLGSVGSVLQGGVEGLSPVVSISETRALRLRWKRPGEDAWNKLRNESQSIPRIVLGLIFVVAFGGGLESKVLLAVVLVFFVVFFNAFQGTRDVGWNPYRERPHARGVSLGRHSRRGRGARRRHHVDHCQEGRVVTRPAARGSAR